MSRRRVLWVSSPVSSSFAGGERVVQRLIDGLSDWDHEFLGGSRALFDLFRSTGREARLAAAGPEPVNPRNALAFPVSLAWGLVHVLRFRDRFVRADVIICPTAFTEPCTVFPWIVRVLGKRPIALWQCPRIPRTIRWSPLRPWLRVVLRGCRSVFVSASQARYWKRIGLIDEATVITNGIPVRGLPARSRSGAPLTLGFLGRMHEEKGVDTLLGALAVLDPPRPLRVLLAGDGPHLERFRRLGSAVESPNLELRWLGWVDEPTAFYDELDLLVVPSREEAFGLVPIEAWQRGVPTLTSDIDSFQEFKSLSRPPECELIFRVGDVDHLADRLRYFLDRCDDLRTEELAGSLHRIVEESFDERRVLREYEELFRSVARSPRPSTSAGAR